MELGADQDLKPSGKVQKSTILSLSLRKDPQWQQHVFSACVDPMNPTEDQNSFSEWVVTSAMLLGADQDLKPSGNVQKSTVLSLSLRNDPQ